MEVHTVYIMSWGICSDSI